MKVCRLILEVTLQRPECGFEDIEDTDRHRTEDGGGRTEDGRVGCRAQGRKALCYPANATPYTTAN